MFMGLRFGIWLIFWRGFWELGVFKDFGSIIVMEVFFLVGSCYWMDVVQGFLEKNLNLEIIGKNLMRKKLGYFNLDFRF